MLVCAGFCQMPAAAQDRPLKGGTAVSAVVPPQEHLTQTTSKPTSRPATQPQGFPVNGDFETRAESADLPAGWTSKHPDNVQLVDTDGPHGLVVEMSGGKRLMASYGVDLTSEKIPVKANTRYRCSGYTKSTGPNMKVFIKGFATVTRRVQGEVKTFDDIVYQMRKDIEPSEDWEPFNLDFEIAPARVFSDFQHTITYVRVRLWAFWPEGTCWFDEICFEEAAPLPQADRRHGQAVTHVGLPPRLSSASQPSTQPVARQFDESQTWRDAANAFRRGDHEQAARLAERLIAQAPHKGTYRVLAARTLAELERWKQAEQHARWLLEEKNGRGDKETPPRQIEPWQRDWARVVRAQVFRHTGRIEAARRILRELLQAETGPSPHARAAAESLLAEIEAGSGGD